MEEAALWRAMKRQVTRGQPAPVSTPGPQPKTNNRPASQPRVDRSISEQDADCMEIDMLEEARYRVYFGFFHLDWLDHLNQTSERQAGLNLTAFTAGGRKKTDKYSNLHLSNGDSGLRGGYLRTRDLSVDRSVGSLKSDRFKTLRDQTLRTDNSMAMDVPHVCSLYGQPQPLSVSFRDDQSNLG